MFLKCLLPFNLRELNLDDGSFLTSTIHPWKSVRVAKQHLVCECTVVLCVNQFMVWHVVISANTEHLYAIDIIHFESVYGDCACYQ